LIELVGKRQQRPGGPKGILHGGTKREKDRFEQNYIGSKKKGKRKRVGYRKSGTDTSFKPWDSRVGRLGTIPNKGKV